ncbi:hypothetical protein [Aristaeella hokkaidonensis]|uniref:Uncharacterized protein n=1 Tax=Aristaeella hokkaidonensis TaxID=3046382 RepID=A0AC61N9G0_9FIRM|nr:hypothetical protein [Aristaeella hokkaidonensis]QUC68209.1 hypothetical protein JYE49_05810 [Aristaeella hokkaidonensis]SNT95231.1 hypothetical protein SAMN06297421_11118 [Aristaeella hokkaidonensis]
MKKEIANELHKFKLWYKLYENNRKSAHINKRILVIESDDWGSIRTPSQSTLKELFAIGDNPYKEPFIANDAIESEQDIIELCNTLSKFVDKNKRPLVFTANYSLCNADFSKITETKKYARETFIETYKTSFKGDNTYNTLKEKINRGFIWPQLHCLEHLSVQRWMKALNNHDKDTRIAFEHRMYGIGASHNEHNKYGYMDTFNYCSYEELLYLKNSIQEATKLFEKIFGFRSKSFVASCYVWDNNIEKALYENGVTQIQTGLFQFKPYIYDGGKYTKIRHYTGEKNEFGQIYTVRNCEFEPCFGGNIDNICEKCISQIEYAFSHNYPAIISSHRCNYIDRINPGNRTRSLKALEKIMEYIIKKYPDIVFMTSDELGEYLNYDNI